MIQNIPFYSNHPDNTHCFQACLKMVLKYFLPQNDYTWEELDRHTAKIEGLWTWSTAGMLWMQELGFEIIDIEHFDYEKFIEKGGDYLIEEYGEEVGNASIQHSNIEQEVELVKKMLQKMNIQKRIPNFRELKNLFEENFVLIIHVNSKTLNNQKGYVGHSVVVKGFNEDKNTIILNDPGGTGIENREVSLELFEKAWAYPDEKAKNIMAFRLGT